MRIVQVANFYAPTSGGLRIAVEETGRGFVAAGHERVLIVPGVQAAEALTVSGRRVTVSSLGLPGLGHYRILTRRQRIYRLLETLAPDVLEVSDKLSLYWLARWGRRHSVPVVLFSHERLDAILRPRVPRWFPLRAAADVVNRRLSRIADRVIVTSAFSGAEFERIGASNVRRIPLGVELAEFRPAPRPSGDAGVPVRLVMVSRLSREKRPECAIETVRVLHERGTPVTLSIVGDGPLRARLERRAAGLPVTFLGHVSDRQALAGLVAGADAALFPSSVETFGLATLEALACGTPVVVPAGGAARELLDGPGSGVVTDGTPEGMAAAVIQLLAMPQRREAARAAAQRYSWSRTVAAVLGEYESISTARRGRSASTPALSRPR